MARDFHTQKEIKHAQERHRRNGRVYLYMEDVVKILDDDELDEDLDDDQANQLDGSTTESSAEECDMINYGFS